LTHVILTAKQTTMNAIKISSRQELRMSGEDFP